MKPKTKEQLSAMQEGGAMLAELRRALIAMVKPGITTQSLEVFARQWMRDKNVQPSFFGYKNYPAVLCVSINEQAVHAVPSNRIVMEGDLVKIDLGIVHKGLHTDTAATVLATTSEQPGQKYAKKLKLMDAAEHALEAGIAAARAGSTVGDISRAIEQVIRDSGFYVLKELGGHGVGEKLHESPWIPNYYDSEYDEELFPGMTLALEPIPAIGTARIDEGPDGFAYVTSDGSLSSHFEHTIAITENEAIILTK